MFDSKSKSFWTRFELERIESKLDLMILQSKVNALLKKIEACDENKVETLNSNSCVKSDFDGDDGYQWRLTEHDYE